jgi:hypothetical protein
VFATKVFLSAARQSAQLGRNAFTSPKSFGCGCAALNNYSEESIMLAKIFRLRVCSVFQDLLLWQRAVWSEQCGLWSVTFDNPR